MATLNRKHIIALLCISLITVSCGMSRPKSPWDFRLDNERIGRIMINPDTAAILISDSRDDKILYYYPNTNFTQPPVVITPNIGVLKACLTDDDIWIVTSDRSLISYSIINDSFTTYPNIANWGLVSTCTVTNRNQLLIWGKDWFAFYGDDWEYESVKDENGVVTHVTRDDNGQIWLLTRQGDILFLAANKDWHQFGRISVKENAHWLSIIDQTLWLYVDDKLFEWTDPAQTPKLILTLSPEDYELIGVQKDNYDSYWILGHTGIWLIRDHQVERLPLPENEFAVMHADFYLENDLIFAATLDGLFSLDVKGVSVDQ